MASLYPPPYLTLPLHVQHRLPPALQSIDFEAAMVLHAALALLSSAFWVHASWALPLALFGLVTAASPLITALMPHFLALWIASIALDVFWLSWRASEARSVVVFMTGVSMVFKVVSAGAAARILQAQGALPDVGGAGGGFGAGGFGGARQPWLSGGTTAPFGLPGSWSGQGTYSDQPSGNGREHQPPHPQQQQRGGYTSIYDEQEEAAAAASESDAPQVRVDNIASTVAQPPQGKASR